MLVLDGVPPRSELEERVLSLEKHVQQLRNVIAKHTGSSMPKVCLDNVFGFSS